MKLCKFRFNTKVKQSLCKSCKLNELNNKVICGVCVTIRNPYEYIKEKDFFAIFNLSKNYNIDKTQLDKQYKDIQKIIHPDKFSTSSTNDIKEAQDCSAYVSNAYNILKDDIKRANYLLKLNGADSIEEMSSNVHDIELLEKLMEYQERIEESESINELNSIQSEIIEKIQNLKIKIEEKFKQNELDGVLSNLKLVKFNLTILENIDRKLYKH
jgi:molecular chaperone HscB